MGGTQVTFQESVFSEVPLPFLYIPYKGFLWA
uniref:Uncharacterized protein n=1 Tax=Anguilla anguilla TaxID=7936 RepID=A0A0E9S7F8_ANGAN